MSPVVVTATRIMDGGDVVLRKYSERPSLDHAGASPPAPLTCTAGFGPGYGRTNTSERLFLTAE